MNGETIQLTNAVMHQLTQLKTLLQQLSPKEYCHKNDILSNASIGEHTRHIIEFFTELNSGYHEGIVNYDKRKREPSIESNPGLAIKELDSIVISVNKENKPLILHACYENTDTVMVCLNTTYNRELAYTIEHTVHHLALIKAGMFGMGTITTDKNFGVAAGTIRYRKLYS